MANTKLCIDIWYADDIIKPSAMVLPDGLNFTYDEVF